MHAPAVQADGSSLPGVSGCIHLSSAQTTEQQINQFILKSVLTGTLREGKTCIALIIFYKVSLYTWQLFKKGSQDVIIKEKNKLH